MDQIWNGTKRKSKGFFSRSSLRYGVINSFPTTYMERAQ